MNSKQHVTSTKSNSSAPVCDGHHHGDRPSEKNKSRKGSINFVDDSNKVNDKLLGVKGLSNFFFFSFLKSFGLVKAFFQQTASLQHKYRKENDLHIELPVELCWQTKVTKVWNTAHFSNVLTGKRENEDLGTHQSRFYP